MVIRHFVQIDWDEAGWFPLPDASGFEAKTELCAAVSESMSLDAFRCPGLEVRMPICRGECRSIRGKQMVLAIDLSQPNS